MTALARLSVLLTAAAGCGGGPEYAPVSGTVTLRKQPLAGATVVFSPDGAAGARPATAVTGADGTFKLQTNLPGGVTKDGAVVGAYKVTVSKFVPPKGMTEAEYAKKVAAQDGTKPHSPDSDLPPRVEAVPKEFSDLAVTSVTVTVTAAGPNEVRIDIP
ncbi:MAG: hypothetical protein C0501_16820 [Isosphaera sp.]|nr:hypothetical protein [Isosphaera sp.]